MTSIRQYISKSEGRIEGKARRRDRFVAYVEQRPSLMIEFSSSDFHVYGPRALNKNDVLDNLKALAIQYRGFGNGRRRSNFFSYATMICAGLEMETRTWSLADLSETGDPFFGLRAGEDPLIRLEVFLSAVFDQLKSLIPDEATYVSTTIPTLGVTHWADLESAPNPRSGFGFAGNGLTFFENPRIYSTRRDTIVELIRSLPDGRLARSDADDVYEFISRRLEERYV